MIEHGLVESSHYRPRSSVSEDVSLVESVSGAEEFVSVSVTDIGNTNLVDGETGQPAAESLSSGTSTEGDNHLLKPPSRTSPESSESDWETLDPSVLEEGGSKEPPVEKDTGPEMKDAFDSKPGTPITVQPQAASGQGGVIQGLVSGLDEDQYGLPLAVFTKVKLQHIGLFPVCKALRRASARHLTIPESRFVSTLPDDVSLQELSMFLLLPGLPVSALHGPAAASPPVRRDGARLCCRGNQHPLPPAAAPQ